MKHFAESRRGAIAMTFAICLVPLVLMIGLAIDYAFYVQTSQKVARAAEAAATQAVRTAAAGYTLDIQNGQSVTTATTDAVSEGQLAGAQWFAACSAGRRPGNTPIPRRRSRCISMSRCCCCWIRRARC